MDDQAARLEEIRKLMYSSNPAEPEDILELTEDDLYDEHQDEEFLNNEVFQNIASESNNYNNNSVNENLTHIQDNKSIQPNLEKKSDDSVISNETASNATESIDTLKKLIKKLEKSTLEAKKPKTLEEVVTVAIKPFLKDWLNQYLHSIVQTIVAKEIKKLVTKKEEKHE